MAIEYNKKYKYKDLCKALDIEPKSGGYRQQQLRNLNKKYDIVSHNNYYIVKREKTDIEAIESMTYHKTKAYLEPMIYTLLTNTEGNVIRKDMKQLLELTATVNQDYFYAKWHTEEVDQELTQDNDGLKVFIDETEPKYKKIIKEVLKDMESRQLIQINEIPMYGKRIKLEDGRIFTQIYEADNDVGIPTFLEAKRLAMTHFGFEHWEDMRLLNYYEWHEAKKIMEDYLKKTLGVAYFYYEYEIILNRKGMDEMLTSDYENMRLGFNKLIKNKTLASKSKNMESIDIEKRFTYVDALVDVNKDYNLRNKKQED